jgi:hypothetical protein
MTMNARTTSWTADPAYTPALSQIMVGALDDQNPFVVFDGMMYMFFENVSQEVLVYRRASWSEWQYVANLGAAALPVSPRASFAVFGGYLYTMLSYNAPMLPTKVVRTADGIIWSAVAMGGDAIGGNDAMLCTDGTTLFVLNYNNDTTTVQDVYTSTDGATWTKHTTTGAPSPSDHPGYKLQGVFALNGYLYATFSNSYAPTTGYVYRIATSLQSPLVWASVTTTYHDAGGTTPLTLPRILSASTQDGRVWLYGVDNYDTPTTYTLFVTEDGTTYQRIVNTSPTTGPEGKGPVAYWRGRAWVGEIWMANLTYAAASTTALVDTPTTTKSEQTWYERPLDDPAHAPAASGYGPGLLVDLRHQSIWPLAGWALDTIGRSTSDGPGRGTTPELLVAGGSDGYLYRAFAADAAGLGTPMVRSRFAVSATNQARTVLSISDSAEATYFPTNMLAGLPVVVAYTDGTEATGTVASNTTTTVTLAAALSGVKTPAALWIAPMECGLVYPEVRYQYPASCQSFRPNALNRQAADQSFAFGVYAGNATPQVTLDGTPDVSGAFTTGDMKRDQGNIWLRAMQGRALAYQLTFRPVGGGYLEVGPIEVNELVHPLERYRSVNRP